MNQDNDVHPSSGAHYHSWPCHSLIYFWCVCIVHSIAFHYHRVCREIEIHLRHSPFGWIDKPLQWRLFSHVSNAWNNNRKIFSISRIHRHSSHKTWKRSESVVLVPNESWEESFFFILMLQSTWNDRQFFLAAPSFSLDIRSRPHFYISRFRCFKLSFERGEGGGGGEGERGGGYGKCRIDLL